MGTNSDPPVHWKAPLVLTLLFYFFLTLGLVPGVSTDPPGPRRAYIVYSSLNVNPTFDDTLRLLRKESGPYEEKLTKDGDVLTILEKDAKDQSGGPSKALTEALRLLGETPLPGIVVVNPKTNHVTNKESLYKNDRYLSAQEIVDLVE